MNILMKQQLITIKIVQIIVIKRRIILLEVVSL